MWLSPMDAPESYSLKAFSLVALMLRPAPTTVSLHNSFLFLNAVFRVDLAFFKYGESEQTTGYTVWLTALC